MDTNLFIHYENQENSNELELKTLCNSLLGFESLLREYSKISRIQADIEVNAKASKDGSYVEWIVLGFNFLNSLPFDNLTDFLEFIQVIDFNLYGEATVFFNTRGFDYASVNEFFTNILNGQTKVQIFVNEFATKRPVEYDLIKWGVEFLMAGYLVKLFSKSKKIKAQTKPDANTPVRVFSALKNIIKRGLAKKAVSPFVENQTEKIGFSQNGKKVENETIVDRKNFGDLLPDSEEILPIYINGSRHNLSGEVKNFQSSRGEFMKINVDFGKYGKYLLVARPDEDHATKNFIQFYQTIVKFEAEILRESLFEKPQLKILGTMELVQEELFPEDNNN